MPEWRAGDGVYQTMEIEHDIKVIPVNDSLPSELEKLSKDGWQKVPGIEPVVVYHLVRSKSQMANVGGNSQLTVDDSKVFILKADGTIQ